MSSYPDFALLNQYDGMHCRIVWKLLPANWVCPACQRSKHETLRWGQRTGSNRAKYGPTGWMGGFHLHHDHARDMGQPESFATEVICGACNTAEGAARKRLGWSNSLSVAQLRGCIRSAQPHGKVTLDMAAVDRMAKKRSDV
jgi:hypothetical protein